MILLLIFAGTLLLGVLLSELASRSVLSAAVLFLAAGFIFAELDVVRLSPEHDLVGRLADFALFAVLVTDGIL